MAPFRPQAMVRHGVTKHLHNVPQGINPKQRNRILARRQLKISRIQSDTQSVLTRLHLHGSAPGCKPPARHPSRKAHAESRARGPHGRFLRKGELAAVRELETGAEQSHHVSPVIQPTDSAVPVGTFLAPLPSGPSLDPMSGDVRVEGRESIITDCVPTEHGQEMKARKEQMLASMFATSRILAKQQMQLKELEEAERRQDDRQERNDECDAITNHDAGCASHLPLLPGTESGMW